jgi:hypothetical protein
MEPPAPETEGAWKLQHPPPTLKKKHVVCISLDLPNVNKAVFTELAKRHPDIAQMPCIFHGSDGAMGHLFEKVALFKDAHKMANKVSKFSRNVSRVRSGLTNVIKRYNAEKAVRLNRKVHTRFFIKGRGSRNYPKYQCVKRAYFLSRPSHMYYSSNAAKEEAGDSHAASFAVVRRYTATSRAHYRLQLHLCGKMMRPLMQFLRFSDSTRHNLLPNLYVRFLDVRGQCINAWVDEADAIRRLYPGPENTWEIQKDLVVEEFRYTYKRQVNKWVLAAYLLDPFHIVAYNKERQDISHRTAHIHSYTVVFVSGCLGPH